MPNWKTQGSHRYYCEADMVFFELHGVFSLADMQCLFALAQEVTKEYGYYLSVFDGREALSMSPEARRYVSELSRRGNAKGTSLVIGATRAMRTVTLLLQNAARLFGKKLSPVAFCSTIEEVPLWAAAQRQQLGGKGVGAGPR